jgi:hypothetical protein
MRHFIFRNTHVVFKKNSLDTQRAPTGYQAKKQKKNKKKKRNLSSVSMLGKALGCGLYQNQGHSWVEGKVPIPKALCGRQ